MDNRTAFLLDQYARSVLRSDMARASSEPEMMCETAAAKRAPLLAQERTVRQRLAIELEQIGHPVLSVRLASSALWAHSNFLPKDTPEASWHIEAGEIVILTSKRLAVFMGSMLEKMTDETVVRTDLPAYQVHGMETAGRARKWLMTHGEQIAVAAH